MNKVLFALTIAIMVFSTSCVESLYETSVLWRATKKQLL